MQNWTALDYLTLELSVIIVRTQLHKLNLIIFRVKEHV